MKLLLGTLMMWGFGSPLYLPWILARIGAYKRWYLAPFIPGLIWNRAVFAWPASAFFVCPTFLYLLGLQGDDFAMANGILGVIGIVFAVAMMGWTPGWAKPKWQRYLEDKYKWSEIRDTFIPVWRKMDRKKWSQLLDSEEGIEELVRIAREEKYGYP